MNRLFLKFQILTGVLFFLTFQLSYSQDYSSTNGERPSIDLSEPALDEMEPGTLQINESASLNNIIQRVYAHDGSTGFPPDEINSSGRNSDALSLPFSENFNGSSAIPAGWTQQAENGLLWKVVSSAGNNYALFRTDVQNSSGLTTRLVTPSLDLSGTNTPVLKFSYANPWRYYNFYYYQDVLRIKYKAALQDEWITLETFGSNVTETTEVTIVLPNPSASYYIAFEGVANWGLGVRLDEIMVNEGVQITAGAQGAGDIYPSGQVWVPIGSSPNFKIRAYNHSHISSLLVDGVPVTEAMDETNYTYTFPSVNTTHTIMASFIYSEAFSVTAEAIPSEAGTVHITGDQWYNQTIKLDAWLSSDRYYFSHWTSNGVTVSTANPFTFVLKSDTSFQAHYNLVNPALTMPVYEGFEAANTIPAGWTQELINGPLWKVGHGNSPYPPAAYAGNNNLVFRSDDPNANGLFTRLITPQIDMTGINTAVLKFQYVNAQKFNTVAHQDQLTVKYKAAYYDSWTTLTTFNSNVTSWTEASIVLPNPSGTYFLAFEGKSNGGYGISIDEVTINEQQAGGFFITAAAVGNGSINPSGQVFVSAGQTQQFNMAADYGYHISSLLVDGQAIAAAAGQSQFSYTFAPVNAAHTITAYFAADALSVTVEVVPPEAGSVSIQGELYYGNTITLWPMSTGDEYVFSHWTSNGVTISTANPFSFVLLSDTLIQAHFTDNGGGSPSLPFYEGFEAGNIPYNWEQVNVSGSGPYLWYIGQGNAPYPPQAYAGSNNLIFKSNDPSSSGRISRLELPELDMTGNATAVLKFQYVNAGYFYIFNHQDWLSVKYKAARTDAWTTLQTLNSDVKQWTEVSIVLPNLSDTYYIAFEGTSNAGYGISIDEVTITGEQNTESFIITAGANGNGSISPSGQVVVPAGETQQFNAQADYGHHISSLLVDGVAVSGAAGESQFTYTFGPVNAAHTIMANFLPDAHSVTVQVVPSAYGTVRITGERFYGETITLTARASARRYAFSHWTAGGVTIGTQNPFTFQLLSDTLIVAHFKLKRFIWTANSNVKANVNGIGNETENSWSESVKVYPNPAKANLYIDLLSEARVLVFDMQGSLKFEAVMPAGTNTINLNGYSQGTYIIKLQFEDEVVTKKFLRH